VNEISTLRGATVLAVGDVMLDEYVWGVVNRISPEAPVPVVEVRRRTYAAGGAANVAAGIVALEGQAFLGGVIGDDAPGVALRKALGAAGVDPRDLVVDASRPTTSKTRVIAHAQQVVRTDHEESHPLPPDVEHELLERVRGRVAEVDAVVLSDYRKGVVSETLARGVIGAATASGKPVVVDPKCLDYARYRGSTVITPNAHDAGQAANVHIEGEQDLLEAARRLSEACDGAALLITRGAAGMTLFSGSGRLDVPTRARDVYDVTGAGDTVVAVLAVALGRRTTLEQAVGLANAAAGIVVGKVGTSSVTLEELERSIAD
jgi:D-glycero-beta-D-manno-heptose-7-phosphate kinase